MKLCNLNTFLAASIFWSCQVSPIAGGITDGMKFNLWDEEAAIISQTTGKCWGIVPDGETFGMGPMECTGTDEQLFAAVSPFPGVKLPFEVFSKRFQIKSVHDGRCISGKDMGRFEFLALLKDCDGEGDWFSFNNKNQLYDLTLKETWFQLDKCLNSEASHGWAFIGNCDNNAQFATFPLNQVVQASHEITGSVPAPEPAAAPPKEPATASPTASTPPPTEAPQPEPVALAAPAPAPSPTKADKDASNVGLAALGTVKGVRGAGGTSKKGKSAASKGDPHFKTFAGKKFDFQVLQNLGLDLNVRTKINSWWSYIDSAVIRIGKDKFEVIGGNDGGQHWVNGELGHFQKHGGSFTISGFMVHVKQMSSKQMKFRVDLGGAAISIETYKSFVAVNVHVRNDMQFIGSRGLMGSFPTGEKMARDGSTVIEDPISFGKEWQVLASEPMLFHLVEGPQHPVACAMPSTSQAESRKKRRLGQAGISQADAEAACAHAGPEEKDACIFDVLATQDKDMAESY